MNATTRPLIRHRLTAADHAAIDAANRRTARATLHSAARSAAQPRRWPASLFRDRADFLQWLACLAIAAASGFALAAELGWLDSVFR